MSTYNRLEMPEEETCPTCGSGITRMIQFKYGDVWQHDYKLGDRIIWDKNNVGEPGHKSVIVSAHPEACPVCGDLPDVRFEISLEEDRIVGIERADPAEEFSRFAHNTYTVRDA